MKLWRNIGDREIVWLLLGIVAIAVWATNALALETARGPSDWELADVIAGKDGAGDVEQKLGNSPCLVPSFSGETVSYLYNVSGKRKPHYLRLEVNGLVDAITLSQDPPLAGVCYAPAKVSQPIRTGKGIELGASIDDVLKIYGEPTERFAVGPMARYRYVAMYDRTYEWNLVFRNGRLVEWTVATEE